MEKRSDNEGMKIAGVGLGAGGAGYFLSKNLLGVDDVPLNALAGTVTAALAMAGYGAYRTAAGDIKRQDAENAAANEETTIKNVAKGIDPIAFHAGELPVLGGVALAGGMAVSPLGRKTVKESVKAMTPERFRPLVKTMAYDWTGGRGRGGGIARTALGIAAPALAIVLGREYAPLGIGRRSMMDITEQHAVEQANREAVKK